MCVWCVRAYNFVTTLRFAVNQPVTAYRHRACTPGTHVVSQQSGLKGQLHHVCQLHTQQGISTNSYTYLPPPLHTHTHTQTHTHTHTHEHTYTFAQEYSLARGRTLAQPILLSPLSWHMSNSWSTTHTCPTCGAPHTLASNSWGTTYTNTSAHTPTEKYRYTPAARGLVCCLLLLAAGAASALGVSYTAPVG